VNPAKFFSLKHSLGVIVISVAVTGLLSATASTPINGQQAQTEASHARQVDAYCREQLGIGLVDLSLLIEARPGEMFSPESLRLEGRLGSLETLMEKGYVTSSRSNTNGQQWLEISPTRKGNLVLNELRSSK
jgi:hypothetical protein